MSWHYFAGEGQLEMGGLPPPPRKACVGLGEGILL